MSPDYFVTHVSGPDLHEHDAAEPPNLERHRNATLEAIGAAMPRVESGEIEAGLRDFVDAAMGGGHFDRASTTLRQSYMDNAATLAFAQPPPQITCEDARSLEVPVLFTKGETTPVSTELENCFALAEIVTIGDASHASHTDNPGAFSAAVVEFLRAHEASPNEYWNPKGLAYHLVAADVPKCHEPCKEQGSRAPFWPCR
jgi:pimeloyl-ACP methyl ester carboxylesterase